MIGGRGASAISIVLPWYRYFEKAVLLAIFVKYLEHVFVGRAYQKRLVGEILAQVFRYIKNTPVFIDNNSIVPSAAGEIVC